jgi:hypothetical protein
MVLRQSWQLGLRSQLLLASLSEVQTLFCRKSHAKNLHLGGAQVGQIDANAGVFVRPTNWAL